MEHLERVDVGHELGERPQIVDREGVDDHALVRRGDLHQAQLGVIGLLPQELRVDGDSRKSTGALAEGGQVLICGDVHSSPRYGKTRVRHG